MGGGGTHPPERTTSLYKEEQLQNALQAIRGLCTLHDNYFANWLLL